MQRVKPERKEDSRGRASANGVCKVKNILSQNVNEAIKERTGERARSSACDDDANYSWHAAGAAACATVSGFPSCSGWRLTIRGDPHAHIARTLSAASNYSLAHCGKIHVSSSYAVTWPRNIWGPGTLIRVGGSGQCGQCTRFNLYQIGGGGGREKAGRQTTNELSGISKLVAKDNKVSKEEERGDNRRRPERLRR